MFNNKEEERHKREISLAHEQNALGLSEKLLEQVNHNVAYDAQVSNRVLETNTRLLNTRFTKGGGIETDEPYPLREPIGDDALSFIDEHSEEKFLLYDIDTNLASVRQAIHKYQEDEETCWQLVHEFNEISAVRQFFLNDTRTTGKPPKLAKSQYVQADTTIERNESKGGKQNEQRRFINF